ncbi:hypothetical protein [Gordonia caeni]|uniref:hypothetical protein n=1 Tax=Gordonia caeni TaxID=1007097 RepID=UPI0031CDBE97
MTATASLTPRLRNRKSAAPRKLVSLRRQPPPTNVDKGIDAFTAVVRAVGAAVLVAPLATRLGRTQASKKVDTAVERFFLHMKVLIGGVAAAIVLLASLIVIMVS